MPPSADTVSATVALHEMQRQAARGSGVDEADAGRLAWPTTGWPAPVRCMNRRTGFLHNHGPAGDSGREPRTRRPGAPAVQPTDP